MRIRPCPPLPAGKAPASYQREHLSEKEHRYRLYRELSLTGKLDEHCNVVQHRAESMIEDVASKIELAEGVTEELKQSDQMEWLKRKQSIHAIAEEFVLSEVVYQI